MTMSASRRRFLLGLAAAGAGMGMGAYPLLSRSGIWQLAQSARKDQAKLKLVFYVVPDGLGIDSFNRRTGEWDGLGIWHPHATAADTSQFELNEVSGLLSDYRAQSLYIRGAVVNMGGGTGSAIAGHAAWNSVLRDAQMRHSSIDVLLGNALKGPGGVRLVHSGPHTAIANPWFVTWDGTSMQAPQSNPLVLFRQLFGESLNARNSGPRSAHVLDTAAADLQDLKRSIGAAEMQKVQTHLDAVEQVASDLGPIAPPSPPTCNPREPELPAGVDMNGVAHRVQVHEAHNQVVATALGCGLMRVATIQVAASAERLNFPDVAPNRNPHDLAHLSLLGHGDADRKDWLDGRSWYVHRFKHFLDELAKQPDPDVEGDRLFDHTLVVLTSEMSDGAPEHQLDMPLLMLGGRHTPLNTHGGQGRYLDITSQGDVAYWSGRPPRQVSMQRIWATLARAAGIGEVPYELNTDTVDGLFTNLAARKQFG